MTAAVEPANQMKGIKNKVHKLGKWWKSLGERC